jgi:hypothetical protein
MDYLNYRSENSTFTLKYAEHTEPKFYEIIYVVQRSLLQMCSSLNTYFLLYYLFNCNWVLARWQ